MANRRGKKAEARTDSPFLGSKNHCRWWLQSWNKKKLSSWKESYDKHMHIKKQRPHLANKNAQSQLWSFWYSCTDGCESWTIKKAECQRVDAFELWCWKRSKRSVPKEITKCSLEGLMLKLRLQYFDYLMRRADSLDKTMMLGRMEGKRRRCSKGWDG